MNPVERSSIINQQSSIRLRFPDLQESSSRRVNFHDHGFPQRRVRNAIRENDPAIGIAGECDVNHFVASITLPIHRPQRRDGVPAGLNIEDSSLAAGRIFGAPEREKEQGADENPRRVDCREQPPADHVRIIAAR